MTKRIEQPSYPRSHSKLLLQELMPSVHIIENIFIDRAGLVVSRPTSVEELKPSLFDKLFQSILDGLGLLVIPHSEVLHFYISELGVRSETHLLNYGVENELNSGVVGQLESTREVFINSLQPANIVMRMRNHMNVELLILVWPILNLSALMLHLFLLFFQLLLSLVVFVVVGVHSIGHLSDVNQALGLSSLRFDL